jgi:hypothetical protein
MVLGFLINNLNIEKFTYAIKIASDKLHPPFILRFKTEDERRMKPSLSNKQAFSPLIYLQKSIPLALLLH